MQTRPYGSWPSPISTSAVTAGGIGVSGPAYGGDTLYWIESRPEEKGRHVLMSASPGSDDKQGLVTVTPDEFSVDTAVHEYGGGEYIPGSGGSPDAAIVFFCNGADQRIYRQVGSGTPSPITPEPPEPGSVRYADACIVPGEDALVAVRERHPPKREAVNDLVWIDGTGAKDPISIASGHDFFSFPRVDPTGTLLAWTTWDHPRMPWDGTELWTARIVDGALTNIKRIAGGPEESIFQPEWGPDGSLYFASDRTGWWNLYRWNGDNKDDGKAGDGDGAAAVAPIEAEVGTGQWVFGLSHYTILADGRIYCVYSRDGLDHIGLIRPGSTSIERVDLPFTYYGRGGSIAGNGTDKIAFVGATAQTSPAIFEVDVSDEANPSLRKVREPNQIDFEAGDLSTPEPIEFPTTGNRTAHALFYPPQNRDIQGPDGELPPLIVKSHGGPTANATSELSLGLQYWTSRGFGVVDVNYGGSLGYGREYRQRLNGQWGIVDVDDCIHAARFLEQSGRVDGKRMAIRGGSAGGYTTLCALTFHNVFAAGASHYGVADLELLATDTHKFESRYLDSMIGPYPEKKETYIERSPVHHAEGLDCPVILFQGLDDPVVPPSQAEAMVRVLEEKEIPFAYVTYPGEKHGFRDAKNVQRTLESELYFYGVVFGFDPDDDIQPVDIQFREDLG